MTREASEREQQLASRGSAASLASLASTSTARGNASGPRGLLHLQGAPAESAVAKALAAHANGSTAPDEFEASSHGGSPRSPQRQRWADSAGGAMGGEGAEARRGSGSLPIEPGTPPPSGGPHGSFGTGRSGSPARRAAGSNPFARRSLLSGASVGSHGSPRLGATPSQLGSTPGAQLLERMGSLGRSVQRTTSQLLERGMAQVERGISALPRQQKRRRRQLPLVR